MPVKAPESSCRGCGATIPAQPSGPGRPRVFCSRLCRRSYYHREEQAEVERERAEEKERNRRAYEEHVFGKRRAAQLAKDRHRARGGP